MSSSNNSKNNSSKKKQGDAKSSVEQDNLAKEGGAYRGASTSSKSNGAKPGAQLDLLILQRPGTAECNINDFLKCMDAHLSARFPTLGAFISNDEYDELEYPEAPNAEILKTEPYLQSEWEKERERINKTKYQAKLDRKSAFAIILAYIVS